MTNNIWLAPGTVFGSASLTKNWYPYAAPNIICHIRHQPSILYVLHQAMQCKMCLSFSSDYRDYNNTNLFRCVLSPQGARANYAKQHLPTLDKIYRCYGVGFSITR